MALRQTSPHPRRRRLHPRRHPRRRRPIRHGLRLHRLPPPPCVGARITSTASRPPRWPPRCASSGSRRASCVGPRPTTLGRGSATKICSLRCRRWHRVVRRHSRQVGNAQVRQEVVQGQVPQAAHCAALPPHVRRLHPRLKAVVSGSAVACNSRLILLEEQEAWYLLVLRCMHVQRVATAGAIAEGP
jgi:hypothetical protein